MQEKVIFGLVGMLSSGKGTVASYIEKKYNADSFRFSTMIRDVLNRLYLTITRENMQDLSTVLRNKFGEDLLANVMGKDVAKSENKIVVVDGIRRMADIEYLKDLDKFVLVRIVADPRIRYERLLKRMENSGDKEKTFDEFLKDEQGEADAQIPSVMEEATEEINNNGNIEELCSQIDHLILKYQIK
jgi:dephospho-CoA kinase